MKRRHFFPAIAAGALALLGFREREPAEEPQSSDSKPRGQQKARWRRSHYLGMSRPGEPLVYESDVSRDEFDEIIRRYLEWGDSLCFSAKPQDAWYVKIFHSGHLVSRWERLTDWT